MTATRKLFLIIFFSVLIASVGYVIYYQAWLKKAGGAVLTVNSLYQPFSVSLDDNPLGATPIDQASLNGGERSLLLSDSHSTYSTKLNFLDGTRSVVNWGLGPSEAFNEGEVMWFERMRRGDSATLVVISDPEGVEIRVDGVLIGNAPLLSGDLTVGEHTLSLTKDGYKSREVFINLQRGYKLNIKAKLLLIPLGNSTPAKVEYATDTRISLYELSTDRTLLLTDTSAWAKGLVYYLSLGREASLSALPYDYLLDYKGQFFDKLGVKFAAGSEPEVKLEKIKIGYLGRTDAGLSDEAGSALKDFAGKALLNTRKVEILATPYGWLRVREQPSTSAKEIAKVNTGSRFELLEEASGWYKIRLTDGNTGYITAAYAKKL